MDYLTIGDFRVSEIGLGCWQAANTEWATGDDKKVMSAIGRSKELGVNLLDTAPLYGDGYSESVVGNAIKEYGRDNFIIATKVAAPHLRQEEVIKSCEASLKRLGIKQIDLYQYHWPDPWEQVPLKHTLKALEKLYTDGRIRAIGVSNFAVRDLEEGRSILSKTDIVSNQLRYNMLQREIEEEVVPYCKKGNIKILAWSPLAQGVLTGRYSPANRPTDSARVTNRLFSEVNMGEIQKLLTVLSAAAKRHQKTVAQIALNWLRRDPSVIPIPGASSQKQAEENAEAVGWKLSDEELREIDKTLANLKVTYFP